MFTDHRGLISLDNNRRKFIKFQRSFSGAIAEYQLRQPKLIQIRFAKMVVIFSRRFQAEEDDPPVVPRELQAEPGLEVNMTDQYANSCDTDTNSCDTDANSCDTDANSCDTDTNSCDMDTKLHFVATNTLLRILCENENLEVTMTLPLRALFVAASCF